MLRTLPRIRASDSLLALAVILSGAALGIVAMVLLGAPVSLGSNIPQSNLMMDYAYGVIFAVAGYMLLLIFPVSFSDRIALLTVWSVKILVVLVFMLFYEDFYWALDSYSYFELPRSSSFSWDGLGIGRGTDNIYNLVWLYFQVFPESFHALKVLFSFVGLTAVYLFYRSATLFLGRPSIWFFYVLALFPSILFWSSIFGKDPIALFGISLYVYGVVGWYRRGNTLSLVFLSVGILVAAFTRTWLGPILLAPLVANVVLGARGVVTKCFIVALAGGALAYILGVMWEQLTIETTEDLLQNLETRSRAFSEGGSAQELTADLTHPVQLLAALPLAMFTALFRPLPGEIHNVFGTLAGIENLILLAMLVIGIKRFRMVELRNPVVLWGVLLILAWTLAYAFISYQNLGGAVRFRLQILPVLLALLMKFAIHRSPAGQKREW